MKKWKKMIDKVGEGPFMGPNPKRRQRKVVLPSMFVEEMPDIQDESSVGHRSFWGWSSEFSAKNCPCSYFIEIFLMCWEVYSLAFIPACVSVFGFLAGNAFEEYPDVMGIDVLCRPYCFEFKVQSSNLSVFKLSPTTHPPHFNLNKVRVLALPLSPLLLGENLKETTIRCLLDLEWLLKVFWFCLFSVVLWRWFINYIIIIIAHCF